MNFLSKKVLQYHQKKLLEAENKLKYHISKKNQLEEDNDHSSKITNEEKMIEIWSSNIEKIKNEIKKIQEK